MGVELASAPPADGHAGVYENIQRTLGRSFSWSEHRDGVLVDESGEWWSDRETGALLERRGRLRLLHLFGTPYERGLGHGRLLRETIAERKVAEFYGDFLYDLFLRSDALRFLPQSVRRHIGRFLESFYYAPLVRRLPREIVEELEGISDGSGCDRRQALRAILAPDIMETLAASFLNWGPSLGNYYLGACSAFYVNGAATRRGAALLARNMDFPGTIAWDPLVVLNHPTEQATFIGSSRPMRKPAYAYVTAAGFPGYGLTGFSEHGIAMSTHVCISRNVSLRGIPSLIYNHYLFTRSRSLDDVEALATGRRHGRRLRCASPHTALFADGSDVLALEVDSKRAVARRAGDEGVYVQTNHFIHPRLKLQEIAYPLEREHTIGRHKYITDAVQANYGQIDRQRAVDIISSGTDPAGKRRPIGALPAQINTLTSVVFEPTTGNAWMAEERPPAVCYGRYPGFNFHDEMAGLGRRTQLPALAASGRPLFGRDGRVSQKRQYEQNMLVRRSLARIDLAQSRLNFGRVEQALRQVAEAKQVFPCAEYEYLEALLHMKDGDFRSALTLMNELRAKHDYSPMQQMALDLWRARCCDMLDRREDARRLYRTLIRNSNVPRYFKDAARRGLRRRFRPADLPKTITLDRLGPLEF